VLASVTYTLGNFFENLTLTGTDDIDGTGNDLANFMRGNSGMNWLKGGDGADSLYGLGGSDVLEGGTGADFMAGGQGGDLYFVDDAGDVVSEGLAAGSDTVIVKIASYTLPNNVEGASANGPGLDTTITGNYLNNTINGGDGDDTLYGLGGDDYIAGYDGSDTIFGGSGADFIDGVVGDDTLDGGGGNDAIVGAVGVDTMTGGTGADKFLYLGYDESGIGAGNRDRITDFLPGTDKIDLTNMDAIPDGSRDAFAFIGNAAFTNTGAGQVRFEAAGTDTLIQVDGDGDGAVNMEILLTGNFSVTANYFVL